MVRRSKLDLYLDVLMAVKNGINRPTNILYKCNLSYKNCKEILRTLTEQGLIIIIKNESNGRRIYKITERGINVLKYFNDAPVLPVSLSLANRQVRASIFKL